jgi:catechol 2,3-dioxygenase-like lactoylglutathione lyase family enzyme
VPLPRPLYRQAVPWTEDRVSIRAVELIEVVLYVGDMQSAVGFYRDALGLVLESESPRWTTFQTGSCTLALHAFDGRRRGAGEPDPTFLVADAAAERERLVQAAVAVSELREPVRGVRVFDFRDPDGNRCSIESRS